MVKLVFSLSSAPFFLFNVGPLAKLFAHTDETAYTRSGQIVTFDPTGLSAYLAWLKSDILSPRGFATELRDTLSIQDRLRLTAALRDAERHLERAWLRPATALRATRRKKAELEAVLATIVTEEGASAELFKACFPDRVLIQKYKTKLAREHDEAVV